MVSLNQGIIFFAALFLMLCQPAHSLTRQSSNNLRATSKTTSANTDTASFYNQDQVESSLQSESNKDFLSDENDEERNRLLQGIGTNSTNLIDIFTNVENVTSFDDFTEEQQRVLTRAAIIGISVAAVIVLCIVAALVACCCGCLSCCC